MSLVPRPDAAITDEDVANVLGRAVRLINPVLDTLSSADPFGLKERTHHLGGAEGAKDKSLDALAHVLNTADVPGTKAWDQMDLKARTKWWVRRVGALNTLFVAFPGIFGALASRLPLQDLLGFCNEAIVLCAVAREHGITDPDQQVRLLAEVLCHRVLPAGAGKAEPGDAPKEEAAPTRWTPFALAKTLWHLAGVMRGADQELDKRPQPRRIFHYLGMLPVVGAVAGYLGEYGALARAAKAGAAWIARQSGQPAATPAG